MCKPVWGGYPSSHCYGQEAGDIGQIGPAQPLGRWGQEMGIIVSWIDDLVCVQVSDSKLGQDEAL